jgi:hypothetical protein
VLDNCDCYDLSYSDLDDVIPELERLIDQSAKPAEIDGSLANRMAAVDG